jgi:hypothetical protein
VDGAAAAIPICEGKGEQEAAVAVAAAARVGGHSGAMPLRVRVKGQDFREVLVGSGLVRRRMR